MKCSIEEFIETLCVYIDGVDILELNEMTELEKMPQWDSLARLSVIAMADGEYEQSVSGPELKNCKTIADLYSLLCS